MLVLLQGAAALQGAGAGCLWQCAFGSLGAGAAAECSCRGLPADTFAATCMKINT